MLEQHSGFLSGIATVSWYIAGLLSVLKLIELLFIEARYGNILSFITIILFSAVLTFLWGIFYFFVVYIIAFIVSVIPYLIIRGIRK